MKISLIWLGDHIDADINTIPVADIVDSFNKITAEIYHYQEIVHDAGQYTIGRIEQISMDKTIAYCPEFDLHCALSLRPELRLGQLVLLYKDGLHYQWASLEQFMQSKQGFIPAISCAPELINGQWRNHWQNTDIIFDIDNKSINHRPDLWGHRGIAREIAAYFQLSLKPLSVLSAQIPVKKVQATSRDHRFSYNLEAEDCTRFSALYIPDITVTPSSLFMAHRLMKIDMKPINSLVDITNYVMADLSQPMHVFDAHAIDSESIYIRHAQQKESIQLLDGQTICLDASDLVISSDREPLSLAGIMGGAVTAVNHNTTALLLESAHFRASTIRHTCQRLGIRTQASTRFEKTLDPEQTIQALQRAIKLLDDMSIDYTISDPIISLIHDEIEPVSRVSFSHDELERVLGNPIDSTFVQNTLKKLEFTVTKKDDMYEITIPSFRATKDIKEAHDVMEEVIRFYGFAHIVPRDLPRPARFYDYRNLYQLRSIKQYFAYSAHMREVYSYALYDEHFLQQWGWEPEKFLGVQDPVSAHYKRLVTSLIPHLVKAVHDNMHQEAHLRFFESGRIWQPTATSFSEKKQIAGIIFDRYEIDFYQAKDIILGLSDLLQLPITWQLSNQVSEPWFDECRTALLLYNSIPIGMFGFYKPERFRLAIAGTAILFWLDQSFLQQYRAPYRQVKGESKFPEVERDISIIVPYDYTVTEIQNWILSADARITQAILIDFFQRDEWIDKRSITIRCTISDSTKTLTKEEIDCIMHCVMQQVGQEGVEIR